MAEAKKQNYLQGAAIMTIGVLVVKVLGAVFKIPLGSMKLLGDEGYSNFTSAYNIYSIFLTLSTAGFPVALSRMISEADALGQHTRVQRTFKVALLFLAALGTVGCLLMMLCPNALARRIGDEQAAQGIFVLGPTVLLVCLMSAFRGYCQGHGNMTPTTVSQILEVAVKVPVGLLLAWIFVRRQKELSLASAGAIFGVFIGSAVALWYLIRYTRRGYDFSRSGGTSPESSRIFRDLIRIGIPITLGGCILAVLNLLDNTQILNRLQNALHYAPSDARVLYGIYGKVQNLYMLPTYFMTPFQASVVPAISAALAARQKRSASLIGESALRTATVVVLPMCVGLGVVAYPVVNILWPGSHEAGPALLRILVIASFFVCMTMLTNALLQANDCEQLPMISMAAGALTKLIVNHILIGIPRINIYGAAVSSVCCFAVIACMNYFFLQHYTVHPPKLKNFLYGPLLSSCVMGGAAWLIYKLLAKLLLKGGLNRLRLLLCLAPTMLVAVAVYLLLVVLTNSIRAEDLKLMPGGEKLSRLLHLK